MPGHDGGVSFSDHRLTFPDPYTDFGLDLERKSAPFPEVRIYETGFVEKPLLWCFRDVLSPFWRLYCNRRAGGRILCEGKVIAMEAGDILLLPERTSFSTEGSFSAGHLWIHFSLMPSPNLAPRVIRIRGTAAIEALALGLAERISHAGKGDNARVHHAALALLHLALAEVDLPSEQVPVLFRKVIRALHDDPGKKWENEEMARLSAMSAGHFIRTFKKVMGLPPRHYLTRLRVRHAARLLAITTHSIEQIAEASGFPNRHYFTRVFTSELEISPAAYRRSAALSGATGQAPATVGT